VAEIDGGFLSYIDEGAGDPVVLPHREKLTERRTEEHKHGRGARESGSVRKARH
jgi:hypothetical protein